MKDKTEKGRVLSFGERLAVARKAKGWSQTKLAEEIGVSPEAVSKWECNAYQPTADKLELLNEVLNLPFYDEKGEPRNARLFDEIHMSAFLKGKMISLDMQEAVRALDYAKKMHRNSEPRKGLIEVPYINHPLTMACHAFALGLEDEELISALLLHDVVEDCGVTAQELPFSPAIQKLVTLVTKPQKPYGQKEEQAYYDAISKEPKACLVKCIDRCNNLSTMSLGFSKTKIAEYVEETEHYYPKLLRVIKGIPFYNSAAWLLQYQIKSLLEMAKRIG